MPSRSSKDIAIEYAGGAYSGSYRLVGEAVQVGSAYGSASARLGALHGSTQALAEILLFGLAQAWSRKTGRQADEALSA